MNKLRKILASALLLIMLFTLTSCGKSSENSGKLTGEMIVSQLMGSGFGSIEGSWLLTDGTLVSELMGFGLDMPLSDFGISITFAFNEGGEFEAAVSMFGMSETADGTWETNGNSIYMTVDGDPLVCSYELSGNQLTLTVIDSAADEDIGLTMIFIKN